MARLLLKDGFTLDKKIVTPYNYPAFTIKYRPAMPDEIYQYSLDQDKAPNGAAKNKIFAKFAAAHVVGWDVEDENGVLAEVNAENIARLPHPLHNPLADALTGYTRKELEEDAKN